MHIRVPATLFTADADDITVSWVGHATLLVGIRGHWFLTDPVFSDRVAGVLRREVEPAIAPAELPPLDAILISHAHFDQVVFIGTRPTGRPITRSSCGSSRARTADVVSPIGGYRARRRQVSPLRASQRALLAIALPHTNR